MLYRWGYASVNVKTINVINVNGNTVKFNHEYIVTPVNSMYIFYVLLHFHISYMILFNISVSDYLGNVLCLGPD